MNDKTITMIITSLIVILVVTSCMGVFILTMKDAKKKYIIKRNIQIQSIYDQYTNEKIYAVEQQSLKERTLLLNTITKFNKNVDPSVKNAIVDTLLTESKKYNIPPLIVLCLIKEESNFNPLVENKSGALGLMQIIPKYHKNKMDVLGINRNELFYIKNNITVGVQILNEYFGKTGDMTKALQKYVGASHISKADKYISNIMSNYITLTITYGGEIESIENQCKE